MKKNICIIIAILAGFDVYAQSLDGGIDCYEIIKNQNYKIDSLERVNDKLDLHYGILKKATLISENIPENNKNNNNTYACIIGSTRVYFGNGCTGFTECSGNDCELFYKYCEKTLCIPTDNIFYDINISFENIKKCFEKLKKASLNHNGNINIIFYVSAMGFRIGDSTYIKTQDNSNNKYYISIEKFWEELGYINANHSICFVDFPKEEIVLCNRMALIKDDTDSNKQEKRTIYIKPKEGTKTNNKIIVFYSSEDNEYSYDISGIIEHGGCHGVFSYFLMKKIQQSRGFMTLGELYEYVSVNVKHSWDLTHEPQTTTVVTYPDKNYNWKNLKLCNW